MPDPGLGRERRRTFEALAETLESTKHAGVPPGSAAAAARSLAEGFGGRPETDREGLKRAIDAIEGGNRPGWFATLSVTDRRATLRDRLGQSRALGGELPPALLVGEAIRHVAAAYHPRGDVSLVLTTLRA
jgi:hypothetical protein